MTPRGRIVVVSGPSGSGKSTILKGLFPVSPVPLDFSVSATTRAARPGEVDGVHYHFLSAEEFARRRERGEFLECFPVYGDVWYGTLRAEVERSLSAGRWVVLDIDTKGALEIFRQCPDVISFFIHPGSLDELRQRLTGRGTETEETLAKRLAAAQGELDRAGHYQYTVYNHHPDEAVREMREILIRESQVQPST